MTLKLEDIHMYEQHQTGHRQPQQAHLTLVSLILHERQQRRHGNQQNMQLPTKEQLPAQW